MHYDPIKNSLGRFFNSSPFLRKLFYHLLDLLLLRTWHIHKELKLWFRSNPAPKDILDAGSGFGQYSYYMAKKDAGYKILSVDVKDEQVADCNDFFGKIGLKNVHFQVEDLTLFKKPSSFDLVLCVDVMEHILEDVQVFRNFHADLRPGGMVLISTPSDQGGSDVSGEGEESFIGEHVRDGYNINEIQEKLRTAGFSRTEARYAYGAPGKIAWRLSMKYPIMALNASKLFFILLPFYYIIAFPVSYILNYIDTNSSHETGTGLIVKAWK